MSIPENSRPKISSQYAYRRYMGQKQYNIIFVVSRLVEFFYFNSIFPKIIDSIDNQIKCIGD